MSIVIRYHVENMDSATYRRVLDRLEEAGAGHPEGRRYHIAYGDPGRLQVIDHFDSQETFEAFGGLLVPILGELGIEAVPEPAPVQNTIVGPAGDAVEVVRRFYDLLLEFWDHGDPSVFDEVVASSSVHHLPGFPPDRDGMKAALPAFRAAFGDFELTVDEIFAVGDQVADRVTWRATHSGELMGIPPSGKRVEVTETHIARVQDGQIVERWGNWDQMGLMHQIGAVPAPAG